jgi:chemotaxis protein histidine kinase CheA
MSFDLIPFESANLPIITDPSLLEEFGTGQKRGFPVISIMGKVFSVSRNGTKEMLKVPGSNAPASALQVVVVRSNPGLTKVFYTKKYVEGSTEKPDCYSSDGQAPASDAQSPQSKSCQTCVHNQWGSRITESGKKAKSCSDVKRLAVAPLGSLEDAMMLRIPAMSLAAWDTYVDTLKRRGMVPTMVATEVSFDYSVAYPALVFKPIGVLPTEIQAQVRELRESEVVRSIVDASVMEVAEHEQAAEGNVTPAQTETAAPAAETETAAPAKAKAPAKTKAAAKAEETPPLEAVVAAATAEPAVQIQIEGGDEILNVLGELDELTFDDA